MAMTVKLPPFPISGGCQCGAVRYRLMAEPVMFYLCHCTECQRHTSSAFGESLRVRHGDLEIDWELALTTRISESGALREGWFCPACGVRVVHGSRNQGELVNIKAGTLDDTSWLVPAGHIWTHAKQPFVTIGADELTYDRQPDDGYAAIGARWGEMISGG